MKSADYETAKATEAALKAALPPGVSVSPSGGALPAVSFGTSTETETRPHKRLKAPVVTRTLRISSRKKIDALNLASTCIEALTQELTITGYHVLDHRLELSSTQDTSDEEGPIYQYIQRYRWQLHPTTQP